MEQIRRIPILWLPIAPIYFLLKAIQGIWLYLMGYWQCEGCKRRFGYKDERHTHMYPGMDMQDYYLCDECEQKGG